MMTFRLADEICSAFPDVKVVLVVAHEVCGDEPWPQVEAGLADLEQAAAAGVWSPPAETDPRVASWHAAYRGFGTNPRRERPSVEALSRRLGRSGRLPRICPPVDAYNLVSVRHNFPAGAFDAARLDGEVTIRYATDADHFTPLGEPDVVERPKVGEVIYADRRSVLTRHWNHRDADRTKVTERSRDVVFLLETLTATVDGAELDLAAADLVDLVKGHVGATARHVLDGANRRVEIPLPA